MCLKTDFVEKLLVFWSRPQAHPQQFIWPRVCVLFTFTLLSDVLLFLILIHVSFSHIRFCYFNAEYEKYPTAKQRQQYTGRPTTETGNNAHTKSTRQSVREY